MKTKVRYVYVDALGNDLGLDDQFHDWLMTVKEVRCEYDPIKDQMTMVQVMQVVAAL